MFPDATVDTVGGNDRQKSAIRKRGRNANEEEIMVGCGSRSLFVGWRVL